MFVNLLFEYVLKHGGARSNVHVCYLLSDYVHFRLTVKDLQGLSASADAKVAVLKGNVYLSGVVREGSD